jgi:hypothetical protein
VPVTSAVWSMLWTLLLRTPTPRIAALILRVAAIAVSA